MKRKAALGAFIFFAGMINLFGQPADSEYIDISGARADYYTNLKFSVFTQKNNYLEINLATQKGYLHSRNGEVKVFGISSGTDKLEDGVKTKEGLFVIQAKLPKWYSRQFDSTLMLNWMGFNFGIGFHALATSGYYVYLGKKKSSHGCIRISRKTAKELYSSVEPGTPVLVHSGKSIIQVKFADSAEVYLKPGFGELTHLVRKIYQRLYSGRYFLYDEPKFLIGKDNVYHQGLPIGAPSKILSRQIKGSVHDFIYHVLPPPGKFDLQPAVFGSFAVVSK